MRTACFNGHLLGVGVGVGGGVPANLPTCAFVKNPNELEIAGKFLKN